MDPMLSVLQGEDPDAVLMSLCEATVERGGLPSRILGATLGRVGLSTLNLGQVVASPSSYLNASPEDMAAELDQLSKTHPEELKHFKVRAGGTRTVDDLLWKKGAKGFANRIGGRVWHNPHTTVLGKLAGTTATLVANPVSSLLRLSHYNPYTDAYHMYGKSPSMLHMGVGKALDYNQDTSKDPTFTNRYARDLHSASSSLNLARNLRAAGKSRIAFKQAAGEDWDSPDTLYRRAERLSVIPAQVSNDTLGVFGLPVTAAAKVIGAIKASGLRNKAIRSSFKRHGR